MTNFVDEKYKESLKLENRLSELIDVDAISAIDLLIERGQWQQALETAKKQNVSMKEFSKKKAIFYIPDIAYLNPPYRKKWSSAIPTSNMYFPV